MTLNLLKKILSYYQSFNINSMKTITIILLMFVSLSGFSQQKDMGRKAKEQKVKMTSEQRAEISSKRMALALDLSEEQRMEIEKLHLNQAADRKAKMAERRKNAAEKGNRHHAQMNKNLDKRLAHQEKMKEILTEEQYAEWKESRKKFKNKKSFKNKKTI